MEPQGCMWRAPAYLANLRAHGPRWAQPCKIWLGSIEPLFAMFFRSEYHARRANTQGPGVRPWVKLAISASVAKFTYPSIESLIKTRLYHKRSRHKFSLSKVLSDSIKNFAASVAGGVRPIRRKRSFSLLVLLIVKNLQNSSSIWFERRLPRRLKFLSDRLSWLLDDVGNFFTFSQPMNRDTRAGAMHLPHRVMLLRMYDLRTARIPAGASQLCAIHSSFIIRPQAREEGRLKECLDLLKY